MKSSSGGAGSTVVVRRWRGSRRARNSGHERSRGVNIGIGKTGAYAVNTGTAGTETGTDTRTGGMARLITAVDTSCAGWRRGMKRGESCWGTWLSGVGGGDEGRGLVEATARRRDSTRQSQTGLTKSHARDLVRALHRMAANSTEPTAATSSWITPGSDWKNLAGRSLGSRHAVRQAQGVMFLKVAAYAVGGCRAYDRRFGTRRLEDFTVIAPRSGCVARNVPVTPSKGFAIVVLVTLPCHTTLELD
jgi:hypothetical protein